MKKLLLISCALWALGASAQNVGIGTNTPDTKLSVNGAISATPVTSAAGATITIPGNTSVFIITDDGANAANAVSATSPKEGQYLTIYNKDAQVAVFGSYTIPAAGSAYLFQYLQGAWQQLSNGAGPTIPDATTTTKGIIQLAGDLTGTAAAPQIGVNKVTSAMILDGTVSSTDIADGTVASVDIADGTVTSTDIADGSVASIDIADGSVSNTDLATMPANTIKGNNTGATGAPVDLTVAETKTMLGLTGTNSGDITLSGQNYLSLSGQALTANAVDLSGSNATGILAAGRFPALTGDVTTTAGSLGTTLSNTGVGAGTYKSVTVDAKGRVTAGTNPTTLAGYGITDAAPASGSGNYIQNQSAAAQSANSWINGTDRANIVRSNSGTGGYVSMQAGSGTQSGYFEVYNGSGTRMGYIGYDNSNMNYLTENSASHVFNGTGAVITNMDLQARQGLYTRKSYYYATYTRNHNINGSNSAATYTIGSFDFCALAGQSQLIDEDDGDQTSDMQCNIYTNNGSQPAWGDNTNAVGATMNYDYNAKPTWLMYIEAYGSKWYDDITCNAICITFDY